MDLVTLGPLVERLGSFILVVWLMIWGATKITTRLDDTQKTLILVSESMARSQEIQARTLTLIDRLEGQLNVMQAQAKERAA